jgi:hypothetical protein
LWESVDPVQKVILYYTLDGGTTWKLIKSLQYDPQYTNWNTEPTYSGFNWPKVGIKPKTKCKVKVVIKDNQGSTMGTDVSDTFFTITP